MTYYRRAIAALPADVLPVFITDDPSFVDETFADLPNRFVSRNQSAVVDMFLLTRCKYNIIANSTFSWWGAWLNNTPGMQVTAPLYHTNWNVGAWNTPGLRVDGWTYVDCLV